MTENEIIESLKENKKKGIGYRFLPEEVQKWIYENFYKKILVYFDYQGEWVSIDETNLINTSNYQNHIFSLSEDFELKEKPQGEWVEFKINKIGRFTDYNVDDDDHQISFSFGWHQWSEFLECSYEHCFGYTTFGGWQYKNCKAWFMQAMLYQEDHYVTSEFEKEPFKTEPAIPIKIRFWRISK